MREKKVLGAVIQDRKAYLSVVPYYEETDFSDMGTLVWNEVRRYYDKDETADHVDKDSLSRRLNRAYPKHAEKFNQFINNLKDVSVANVLEDFRAAKQESLAELVGGYLMTHEYDKAQEYIDKYQQVRADGLVDKEGGDIGTMFNMAHIDDFKDVFSKENRIILAPKSLNEKLGGGLIPGMHLLFYAVPETGKTAMAINQAFASCWKGHKVLYVGNEDPAPAYLSRMLSRFTGWTREECEEDPEEAMVRAEKRGWGNLFFYHCSPGTTDEVKAKALEVGANVVILDQLHNLKHSQKPKAEGTQLLTELAYTMRMFYSKHGITGISFTQADEKAIGKLHLTIRDVYYSNIGVQGQTDVMIGIGMDANYQKMGRRMLSFTKNKCGGDHGQSIVVLKPKVSTYVDLE